MTVKKFATQQREILITTEKQSAILLAAQFEAMKREISKFLLETFSEKNVPESLRVKSYLERILLLVDNQIDRVSIPFSQIVARAQRNVIIKSSNLLKRFLRLELDSAIFSPDREAIRQLIGRAFDGNSLQKFFLRMKAPMRDRVRVELIEGFALGESHQQIARRIASVSDAGYTRALTISRTETNTAYRAASREFYQAAGIKQYVWLSVLDPRTCLVCWHLHGQKFKSSAPVFGHVNCRCVLVPLVKNQKPIATGAENFSKLEAGYQKQILGAKRFEMFQASEIKFEDFVGSRFDAQPGGTQVRRFFVKNLSDLPV